jgi:ATP-dependent Clp protease ATP-binding subunit ClpA
VQSLPKVQGGGDRMYAAVSFNRALDAADQAATKAGDSYVTAERLLFGLAIADGKASEILKKAGSRRKSSKRRSPSCAKAARRNRRPRKISMTR